MTEATEVSATVAFSIEQAEFPRDLRTTRTLFQEYAAGVGVDLCFQGFDNEVATLPGRYAPPSGRLLLVWRQQQALGCVALRALTGGACEMKRLYVRPEARGQGLGRQLIERVCEQARAIGYARLCLDTLPSMGAARALYRTLGFQPIEPYVFNPIAGAQYLALDL